MSIWETGAIKPQRPTDDQIDALVADVLEAAGALRRHGELQASTAGQSQARWQVLSVLSDEAKTVPAAARRLGVSRQAVQRVVDALGEANLVDTLPNPRHARSPLIALTDRGHAVLAELTRANAPWNREIARALTSEDVDGARDVLGALIERGRASR